MTSHPRLPMKPRDRSIENAQRWQDLGDAFNLDGPAIEPCERRDALSANLVGSCLADFTAELLAPDDEIEVGNQSQAFTPIKSTALTAPAANAASVDTLLDQAAQVHAERELRGSGQTIAIIDSGIAYDHRSLGGGFGPGYRVVGGWDFAENDADPYDDAPGGFHGSHVAGLAAGSGFLPNGDSFQGVAPEADLVGLRVFDDSGAGLLSWVESALQWVHTNQDAFEHPITTVNLSLAAEVTDGSDYGALTLLDDELRDLYEDDILVFAAAGNDFGGSQPGLLYPASNEFAFGVGSID
ncbi:MAG: S8 family serine peptidase, partial [Planctomycetota bacterium]